MHRLALCLSLAFATAVVQAADPVPAATEPAMCPKQASGAEKPAQPTATQPAEATPGATAPVRPRSGGAAGRPAPRWNSLLPGMIR